jgi:hypothetical protein
MVHINYYNLKYFITKQKLTKRQVRWAKSLVNFNFIIKY